MGYLTIRRRLEPVTAGKSGFKTPVSCYAAISWFDVPQLRLGMARNRTLGYNRSMNDNP